MSSLCDISGLSFFKSEMHEYINHNSFDASNCPRPHFCMGFILEGQGEFRDCIHDNTVSVKKGDIIFVPMTSRYVSSWQGNPKISYISLHFIFNSQGVFTKHNNFILQKITPDDFDKTKSTFEFLLQIYENNESMQLSALAKFYGILSMIYPHLETKQTKKIDSRISKAIKYIEQNYNHEISTESLAKAANMSVSRFFPCFKKATGMTATEYLNAYRINRAILLLIYSDNESIEYISETVGFSSSTYFRRVFKSITGKTPREYKKTGIEI